MLIFSSPGCVFVLGDMMLYILINAIIIIVINIKAQRQQLWRAFIVKADISFLNKSPSKLFLKDFDLAFGSHFSP